MKRANAGSLLLMLVVGLLVVQSVAAQGVVTVKLDSVNIDQFPTVVAYATVIDENGLPVTGLSAAQFELIEDGKASFPPEGVKAITNDKAAVSVLVLIDLGGTMKGAPLEAAKIATAKFLEKLLNEGNDPDQAAFIGFGQQVDIKATTLTEGPREVPFTNDMGRLLNVVNFIEVEKQAGTPLYDAVYRAVKITAQQPGRRAIIVMTDGGDVGSTLKQDDPINEARRQRIPVFPIGLSNSRLDKTYLNRLAELTGGQYQEAPAPEEIGPKFDQVLGQLKIQYELTFQSRLPQPDGQYHSLLLRVNTARGQGFDEVKFQLGQPSPEPLATAAPQPGATVAPQPMATPIAKGEESMGIMEWISNNIVLVVGIAAAALFLLLLLIVLVIVLMRRRSAAQAQAAWTGSEGYGAPAPAWPVGGETSPNPVIAGPEAGPTVMPEMGAAPTGAGTQLAAPVPPSTPAATPFSPPPPFGAPPPPPKPAPAEPPPAGGTVIIQRGPKPKVLGMLVDRKQPSRRYDVDKTVTIGRAPGNTIVIDHPTVSRQHATIKLEGTDFRLYDLGSANGTFVGDKRLREPITLQDGMTIRFGEVEFTFKRVSLE